MAPSSRAAPPMRMGSRCAQLTCLVCSGQTTLSFFTMSAHFNKCIYGHILGLFPVNSDSFYSAYRPCFGVPVQLLCIVSMVPLPEESCNRLQHTWDQECQISSKKKNGRLDQFKPTDKYYANRVRTKKNPFCVEKNALTIITIGEQFNHRTLNCNQIKL